MWWEVCSGGNNIDGETVSVTVAVVVGSERSDGSGSELCASGG